jgi:RNA polymerase-binding transcription factor DksA
VSKGSYTQDKKFQAPLYFFSNIVILTIDRRSFMLNIETQRRALKNALAEMGSPDLRKLRQALAAPIEGRDDFDQADEASGKELVALRLERRYMEIAQARIAASKLNEGLAAYTKCSGCEGEIKEGRLIAVPWAILCTACQERQDEGDWAEDPPDAIDIEDS